MTFIGFLRVSKKLQVFNRLNFLELFINKLLRYIEFAISYTC
jgi:hypothetical protein